MRTLLPRASRRVLLAGAAVIALAAAGIAIADSGAPAGTSLVSATFYANTLAKSHTETCTPTSGDAYSTTDAVFTVSHSFAGHTMVELIEQHNDAPSVFNELGPNYGFHHWGVMTKTFDADVARYQAMGYEEAFFDTLPTESRVMYLDARRDLPGMIELLEHTDAQERVYTGYWEATVGWDGKDPIRRD